jgi:hypothetical protein
MVHVWRIISMAIEVLNCSNCPRQTEQGRLHRSSDANQYCFDCPGGYRASAFTSLIARVQQRKVAVRSCTRKV